MKFTASFIALALCASTVPGQQPADSARRVLKPRTMYEDLQMLTGVLNQIRVNHPDTVDAHELIMAAIQGMVRAADPHSYVTPYVRLNAEKEKAYREKRLVPVPIYFQMVDGAPVVLAVAHGTDASKLDILPGDELIVAEGQPLRVSSPDELDITLAGSKGSTARLTFERRRSDGTLVQFDRDVKRQRADEVSSVPTAFMIDAQTGYARITAFDDQKVADDLHSALARLEKQGMKRLVLDLRDNPGGIVDQAAAVTGEFLPKGAIVYSYAGRTRDKAFPDTVRVSRSFWQSEKRYPIVVLINSGSASASELVAGALQDHDRALIVGRPSFGKSLLMTPTFLPDGSMLMLVVGHLRTPCGRVIQRDYHGLTTREYRRGAVAERDTMGRPSCKTAKGRTVYGGGGVYPDVLLPEGEGVPAWFSRVSERSLLLAWIAGHMSANAAAYPSLAAAVARPEPASGAVEDFRKYSGAQGVAIPPGEDADRLLRRQIILRVAYAKWADEGYYRVMAALDPEISAGVAAFDKAAAILASQ